MNDAWLDGANAADLDAVAQALLDGRLVAPYGPATLQLLGADAGARAFLADVAPTPPLVIAWMLRRLARERRHADARLANAAQLVWSGISEGGQPVRDTRVVLNELFQRAERHVMVATFVVYEGRAVFAALTARLRACPGLDVEVYVNLPALPGAAADESHDVAAYLDRFAREHWPADLPLPALYFDPATRGVAGRRASLHAKCAVVDERWALVTSANFTEAAQERNLETGVLLDQPGLAQALVAQFRALRESGKLRRMR